MSIGPDGWHRSSVAIRGDRMERVNALVKALGCASVSDVVNLLIAEEPEKVAAMLEPLRAARERVKAEDAKQAKIVRSMRKVRDPAVLQQIQDLLGQPQG
jgi:hypothetical protein